MQKFLTYLIILLFSLPVKAQLNFSDSLQISLLTCTEGPDAYERFGHSAVRILDYKNQQDIVFHWGVFNFNAPNFVWRFVKGETDYQLGATYTQYFIEDYAERGLGMTEAVLNLNQDEAKKMLETILENYKPENSTYRYSFFFDNCATRPFNVINKATEYKINYDTAWVKDITLRDMLHEKTDICTWLQFGISLAVANRADKQAYFTEQMFLPEYLEKAYMNANLLDKPLIKEKKEILKMRPEIREEIDSVSQILFGPGVILLIVYIAMMYLRYKSKKRPKLLTPLKTIYTIILLGTGIAGTIVWFLNFFSEHPSVDNNVNCILLLPTNVIFAVTIWLKSAEKVNRIYFWIIFATIGAYAIINLIFVHQYFYVCICFIILLYLEICAQIIVKDEQEK